MLKDIELTSDEYPYKCTMDEKCHANNYHDMSLTTHQSFCHICGGRIRDLDNKARTEEIYLVHSVPRRKIH